MSSNSLNVYPSTSDLPRIAGAQEDPVLKVLKSARLRYARYGTDNQIGWPTGSLVE